jgi:hypothetical protein
MGFIRRQEEKFALQLLQWQYNKTGQPAPDLDTLRRHARVLVDDAHRIARQRGGNILAILKEAVSKDLPP